MPSWDQIMAFVEKIGMPWSFAAAFMFVYFRTIRDLLTLVSKMSVTLDHVAQHLIDENHDHRKKEV